MPFGLSPQVFYHVVISLIGIAAGFVVIAGMLSGKKLPGWTAWFLSFTVLTSATGFALPATEIKPAHVLGFLSVGVLGAAIFAYYSKRLAGGWRAGYVISALLAQYLNVFVLVVQSFQKISALKALAPNQNEPPFLVAQLALLGLFVVLGIFALRKFRPAIAAATA